MTEDATSGRIPAQASAVLRLLSVLLMTVGALLGASGTIVHEFGGALTVAAGNALLFAGLSFWPWPERNRITALLAPIAWGWIGLPILAVMAAAVQLRRMLAGDGHGDEPRGLPSSCIPQVPLWAAACAASSGVAVVLGLSGVDIGIWIWITGL